MTKTSVLISEMNTIQCVSNFQKLVATTFYGEKNAAYWSRTLHGDFSEVVNKIEVNNNIMELDQDILKNLHLTSQGQLAREILLNDLHILTEHGAAPTLNLIKCYERDSNTFFPTDVYSFHVDRSLIPIDTFLCTYHGEASEIVSNSQAKQKILITEIREEIKKKYQINERDFESFLSEHFFDLHYNTNPEAKTICLGKGNLWRLATDHPGSKSLPCIHRAPIEKDGETRLLLIC
jgi:hypothetical protein